MSVGLTVYISWMNWTKTWKCNYNWWLFKLNSRCFTEASLVILTRELQEGKKIPKQLRFYSFWSKIKSDIGWLFFTIRTDQARFLKSLRFNHNGYNFVIFQYKLIWNSDNKSGGWLAFHCWTAGLYLQKSYFKHSIWPVEISKTQTYLNPLNWSLHRKTYHSVQSDIKEKQNSSSAISPSTFWRNDDRFTANSLVFQLFEVSVKQIVALISEKTGGGVHASEQLQEWRIVQLSRSNLL